MTGSLPFSAAGTSAAPAAVDCSVGQHGHVWFLAGTFLPTSEPTAPLPSSNVYRSCTIPDGTALFVPLINQELDNLSCDASGTPTSSGLSAARLRGVPRTAMNDLVPGSLSASVDGYSVPGLRDGHTRYRARSPLFSYTLPSDNVGSLFGCTFPAGTTPPPPEAAADGVYVMLAPLRPGVHTIRVGAQTNVPGGQPGGPFQFLQNISCTITVTRGHDQ